MSRTETINKDRVELVQRLHGFMRGSVVTPAGADLTVPTVDEPLTAEKGKLHAPS